jgi:protein tyrosine/serine phosphatase
MIFRRIKVHVTASHNSRSSAPSGSLETPEWGFVLYIKASFGHDDRNSETEPQSFIRQYIQTLRRIPVATGMSGYGVRL